MSSFLKTVCLFYSLLYIILDAYFTFLNVAHYCDNYDTTFAVVGFSYVIIFGLTLLTWQIARYYLLCYVSFFEEGSATPWHGVDEFTLLVLPSVLSPPAVLIFNPVQSFMTCSKFLLKRVNTNRLQSVPYTRANWGHTVSLHVPANRPVGRNPVSPSILCPLPGGHAGHRWPTAGKREWPVTGGHRGVSAPARRTNFKTARGTRRRLTRLHSTRSSADHCRCARRGRERDDKRIITTTK